MRVEVEICTPQMCNFLATLYALALQDQARYVFENPTSLMLLHFAVCLVSIDVDWQHLAAVPSNL